MDDRSLRLFLSLVEHMHFGRASAACHVSPSALSRTIRQLEETVGTPLFWRDNRSVSLTEAGRRFQDYATETLRQWEGLKHSLKNSGAELRGELSLYCSVTASYSFLYDMLNRFRRDHPFIELKLHTGDAERAVERVRDGREDIAIGARPDSLPAGVLFQPLAETELCFIGPRAPALLSSEQIADPSASSWRDVPMILSEEGLARTRVDRWLRGHGIRPMIYAQVAGNEAIVSMVSLGFGIGVVPRIVLENSPLVQRIRRYDLQPALPRFEIGLFALEKKLKEPQVKAFWTRPAGDEP